MQRCMQGKLSTIYEKHMAKQSRLGKGANMTELKVNKEWGRSKMLTR